MYVKTPDFINFANDTEMARLVREHDWASSPLGPISAWPHTLKVLVEFMLASPLIASIACGPERLLLYNDAAARLYGDRHPLVLGCPLTEGFPESYSQVALFYDRVFAGEPVHVPAQPLDLQGNGMSYVFDAYLTPVCDDAGEVAYAFMTGFDISRRLQAEAERDGKISKCQESEDTLRLALEVAEVGTWTWNLQDHTGHLDVRCAAIMGLPVGPLANLGDAQRAAVHPDDRTRMEEQISVGITGNEPFSLNYRVIHADGSVHFIASRAQAFTNETGVPVQLVGTNRDVTTERLAEIGLRETEERQAFLLKLSDALRPLAETAEIQGEACRQLGEYLGVDNAYCVEIYEHKDFAVVERDYVRGRVPSLARRYPLSAFRWAVALYKQGKPVIVTDLRRSHLVPDSEREAMEAAQVISWVAVPLVKAGELVGALCVTESKPREWTDRDVDLTRESAERIWAAMGRARAEAALRESEARLRTVFEGIPQLVWRSHDNGRWTWASPQWMRLTGQSHGESVGQGWLNAVHPEDREVARSAWANAATAGILDVEYRVWSVSDDAYLWHHTRALPVRNEQNQVLEWLGTSTDIEQLRKAEAARREAEENFRLFVDNVHEYALVQTDPEGSIVNWNPGAQRLFGYSPEQMVGQNFSALLTTEDQEKDIFFKELAWVAEGRRNEDARWFVRADGSHFWARLVSEPILDETGSFRGMAKVMRDETEREQAAAFTRHSLAEKEELLKEVHHRVKNNLQVIISLLNLQAMQIEEQRVLALLEETRNRVQAISSIHEQAYGSESFASIHLLAYARQLAPDLVRFYGLEQRIRVEVVGDDTALELERAVPYGMLLNELVSNACKHAFPPPGAGTITIGIQPIGDLIELTVSDSGQGLPAGINYRQTSSLGLKLVHGLVRQLRGKLQIRSEAGTTVQVRFPATDK